MSGVMLYCGEERPDGRREEWGAGERDEKKYVKTYLYPSLTFNTNTHSIRGWNNGSKRKPSAPARSQPQPRHRLSRKLCTTLTENVGNIKIYNVSQKYYRSIKNSTDRLLSALVTSGPTAGQQQQQKHFILIWHYVRDWNQENRAIYYLIIIFYV